MVQDPGAFRRRNIELWKQRKLHAEGKAPKPEPQPMDPAVFGVIQKAG